MIHKKSKLFAFLFLFQSTTCIQAERTPHPFYIGMIGGYGATTWKGLVATTKNQNLALMLSTPISVEEGGATWGALAGYEFNANFALEANYLHYADATVYFNPVSLFSFTHDGTLSLITNTQSISLMAKILLFIPNTNWRIYSSAGAAGINRQDIVINAWRLSPTFGAGLNYNFTEHLMAELVGNYTAGFGQSQLSPVDSYFPFLYSVTIHAAYRF